MNLQEILKKDGVLRTGNVFKDGNFYPYSIQYIGEDESGDGSVFYIKFLRIDQEFLEEDVEEFFTNTVSWCIESFLEDRKKEEQKLQSLTNRYFESDINFLKDYAKENNKSYQKMMREIIHKGVLELQN